MSARTVKSKRILAAIYTGAMKAAEWVRAKRLLALRRDLSAQVRDSPEELATLVRAAEIIEYAYAHEPRKA